MRAATRNNNMSALSSPPSAPEKIDPVVEAFAVFPNVCSLVSPKEKGRRDRPARQ